MTNRQIPHNNINYGKKEEFEPSCVAIGCNNKGVNPLKVIYINKVLRFCDTCKQDMLKLKLVEE